MEAQESHLLLGRRSCTTDSRLDRVRGLVSRDSGIPSLRDFESLRRSKHFKIEALHIFVIAFVFKTRIGGPAPRLHRVYARRLDPVACVSKEYEGRHRRRAREPQSESRSKMIAQDDRSGGRT